MRHASHKEGFTLVEVLVALIILAIALAAIIKTTGLAADSSTALKQRMLAIWEVENRLEWMHISGVWPQTGITQGTFQADGQNWRWEQQVMATPNPHFHKVTIRIFSVGQSHNTLAELSGYVYQRAGLY